MPLVAVLDGERVDATAHTEDSWARLKASEDRRRLVLPICNTRAVAKSRGQRTRFFAHYRLADCSFDHGGESPQHLALKEALAVGIGRVPGWHAAIEFPHPSREWIIDVLAESDDRRHRVAFEVQLSSQTAADYAHRTQRYFDSGAFPVWLVPRDLEYSPLHLPVVTTGFGKSSPVPGDPNGLLQLEVRHNLAVRQPTLGGFIENLLVQGPRWDLGTPQQQQQRWDEEQRRHLAAQRAETERMTRVQLAIENMDRRSIAPEKVFDPHTVHTESGPFVWATLTNCHKCGHQMMLWEASSPRANVQYSAAPPLRVKSEVGPKRYENHPDVHRAIGQWVAQTGAAITQARIEVRHSHGRGKPYSAFVCPVCSDLIGQFYIAQIDTDHWSLLSAPLLRKTEA